MKAFLIFLVLAPHFSIQQYDNMYGSESHMSNYHHNSDSDYPDGHYRRSRRRYKKKRYGSSGGKLPRLHDYDDSSADSCECECQVCDPRPCCKRVCDCETGAPPDSETGQNYGGPTNVVFVPYPFPLVVPGSQLTMPTVSTTAATIIMKTTNSTTPTTTGAEPRKVNSGEDSLTTMSNLRELLDLIQKNTRIRMSISKRDNPFVRPMKMTTTLPKYGIVPLPDHLLESLISQVRNVKDLQSYS